MRTHVRDAYDSESTRRSGPIAVEITRSPGRALSSDVVSAGPSVKLIQEHPRADDRAQENAARAR